MIILISILCLCVLVFVVGVFAGHEGWVTDSRLDKLRQKECQLVAELATLSSVDDSYSYFMAIQRTNRPAYKVAGELAKVRAAIIRCGESPRLLSPKIQELLQQENNQK